MIGSPSSLPRLRRGRVEANAATGASAPVAVQRCPIAWQRSLVVSGISGQEIVAVAAEQMGIAVVAQEPVVAVFTLHDVVAAAAQDVVVALAGQDYVFAVIALNKVVAIPSVDDVVTSPARQVVVAVGAVDGRPCSATSVTWIVRA
jgi:hypothetical protein